MELVNLLEHRNQALKHFLTLSRQFVANSSETPSPNWLDEVGELLETRDEILTAIRLFDEKISEKASLVSRRSLKDQQIEELRDFMESAEALRSEIIRVDDVLLKFIDDQKSKLLAEISLEKREKDKISKFKSAQSLPTGEGIDRKL